MNNELVKEAVQALSIHEVRLHKANAFIATDYEPLFPTVEQFGLQARQAVIERSYLNVKSNDDEEHEFFRARYQCAFRLVPDNLPPETLQNNEEMKKLILAEVTAEFMAIYAVAESKPSEDALIEFCKFNVGYHVWPYWREYASSTATRLRLPPVVLPLYKIPNG